MDIKKVPKLIAKMDNRMTAFTWLIAVAGISLNLIINLSFPFIGQKMGGKDHTTVIHSYEKIKLELERNTALMSEIERIRSLFK